MLLLFSRSFSSALPARRFYTRFYSYIYSRSGGSSSETLVQRNIRAEFTSTCVSVCVAIYIFTGMWMGFLVRAFCPFALLQNPLCVCCLHHQESSPFRPPTLIRIIGLETRFLATERRGTARTHFVLPTCSLYKCENLILTWRHCGVVHEINYALRHFLFCAVFNCKIKK